MDLHPLQYAHGAKAFHEDLLAFIDQGLHSENGRKPGPQLPLLEGQLARNVVDSLALIPSKPIAFSRDILDQGYALVFKKYLTWLMKTAILYGESDRARFVFLPTRLKDARAMVTEVLGPETERDLTALDPAQKAFAIAAINQENTQSRLAALYFLLDEAMGRRAADADLAEEVEQVAKALRLRLARYFTTWLTFAMLIGGEALEEARAEVIRRRFGKDMAVLGYMNFDEEHPGFWRADMEEEVRDNIQSYADKPLR